MVYGAWPNNAVPLTEDSPVRPNPDLPFAVYHAEAERRALEWRAAQSHSTLSILRPAPLMADDQPSRVAALLRSVATVRTQDGEAPAQYLHVDDLVAGLCTALLAWADGVLNVSPDGWIPPARLAGLAYPGPRPMLPMWAVRAVARLRWRFGIAGAPPGLVPYTVHPWVVANDRLRALGWQPANTNEEAYVLGHHPGPLDKMTAKRRQELALGGLVSAVAAVAAGVFVAIRRYRRR